MITIEKMSASITVNAEGGYIRACRGTITGLIYICIYNTITKYYDEFTLDAKDTNSLSWLKRVFQPIQLEVLLNDGVKKIESED